MRNYFLKIMACILLVIACTEANSSGELEIASAKRIGIVGGELTSEYEAVGVLMVDDVMQCTATLIGMKKILTAAHCVTGLLPQEVTFATGPKVYEPLRRFDVARINIHPDFDPETRRNDIATLYLSTAPKIPFIRVNRRPMNASWIGQDVLFIGYGADLEDVEPVDIGYKRIASMTIDAVDDDTFQYGDAGKNTCIGDSGGPAIVYQYNQPRVIGITSNGDPFCMFYGIDVRVDRYIEFIYWD